MSEDSTFRSDASFSALSAGVTGVVVLFLLIGLIWYFATATHQDHLVDVVVSDSCSYCRSARDKIRKSRLSRKFNVIHITDEKQLDRVGYRGQGVPFFFCRKKNRAQVGMSHTESIENLYDQITGGQKEPTNTVPFPTSEP